MGSSTSISWCDATINLQWGCTKVDRACDNCYMFRLSYDSPYSANRGKYLMMAHSERKIPLKKFDVMKKFHEIEKLGPSKKRIFINSMSDTFHEDVPEHRLREWHEVLFENFPDKIFILLTKRIGRAMLFYRKYPKLLFDHLWIGCSIGEKKRLWRLDQLRQIPAKVRFVSFEPLIEDLGDFSLKGIQWAIVGGESGFLKKYLRPMDPLWALNIQSICNRDLVPFYFKQMGGIGGDGAGGDFLYGLRYQALPEFFTPKLKKDAQDQQQQITLEAFI
jgi:protein gp37